MTQKNKPQIAHASGSAPNVEHIDSDVSSAGSTSQAASIPSRPLPNPPAPFSLGDALWYTNPIIGLATLVICCSMLLGIGPRRVSLGENQGANAIILTAEIGQPADATRPENATTATPEHGPKSSPMAASIDNQPTTATLQLDQGQFDALVTRLLDRPEIKTPLENLAAVNNTVSENTTAIKSLTELITKRDKLDKLAADKDIKHEIEIEIRATKDAITAAEKEYNSKVSTRQEKQSELTKLRDEYKAMDTALEKEHTKLKTEFERKKQDNAAAVRSLEVELAKELAIRGYKTQNLDLKDPTFSSALQFFRAAAIDGMKEASNSSNEKHLAQLRELQLAVADFKPSKNNSVAIVIPHLQHKLCEKRIIPALQQMEQEFSTWEAKIPGLEIRCYLVSPKSPFLFREPLASRSSVKSPLLTFTPDGNLVPDSVEWDKVTADRILLLAECPETGLLYEGKKTFPLPDNQSRPIEIVLLPNLTPNQLWKKDKQGTPTAEELKIWYERSISSNLTSLTIVCAKSDPAPAGTEPVNFESRLQWSIRRAILPEGMEFSPPRVHASRGQNESK